MPYTIHQHIVQRTLHGIVYTRIPAPFHGTCVGCELLDEQNLCLVRRSREYSECYKIPPDLDADYVWIRARQPETEDLPI